MRNNDIVTLTGDEYDQLVSNAKRYLWLRDIGCKTFKPFTWQWQRTQEECDETIDIQMDATKDQILPWLWR